MQRAAQPRPEGDRQSADALDDFCADVFADLPRADQRRWAGVYVRGLVTLDGRKTISRIGASITGRRVEQNLQQFLNQSPWDWGVVRRQLAHIVDASVHTRAWVIGEVALPRTGSHSVGVDRQFAYSAQRTMNCQLAMTAFLSGDGTAEHEAVPVDWRLMLPRGWERDALRRHRAAVPDDECGRTRTGHLLTLVDTLAGDWGLPAAPVVYDSRPGGDVADAVAGLEARRHHYLVRVDDHATLSTLPHGHGTVEVIDYVRRAVRLAEGLHPPEADRAAQLQAPRPAASRLGPVRPRVFTVPAPPPRTVPAESEVSGPPRRARHLAATWHPHHDRPGSVWLTNLPAPWLRLVPGLIASGLRVRTHLRTLAAESGLPDFEGRSYRGWHHHTTLVSAAHAYRVLERVVPVPRFW